MPKYNTKSKTMLLHAIHNAVFNTLNDSELLRMFEKRGIGRPTFEDGRSIYEHATLTRAAEIAIEDDLHQADAYLKKFQKTIRDEYSSFTEAAKKCFGRDSLKMLGLHNKLPRTEKSFIDSAQQSILKVKEHPELMNCLSGNGFDETRVVFASLIIQLFGQVSKDKEMLKKQLVTVSKEREASFSQVVTWLQSFTSRAMPVVHQETHLSEKIGLRPDELDSIIDAYSSKPVQVN